VSWTIHEPVVRWLGDAARSSGPARGALVVYDALDFEEGDDPEAALWGHELDDWMYSDGDADADDEDDCRGYPAGWISLQAERIAEAIYGPNFFHPIFPLGIAAYGGVIERLPRPTHPTEASFFAQRIMVDVGVPTLFLALRRDGASLQIRGADHSHRDGAPAPESWETMDRAWGNRSFELVVPWDAFWAAYDAAWREG
jgi:hypothetical protein